MHIIHMVKITKVSSYSVYISCLWKTNRNLEVSTHSNFSMSTFQEQIVFKIFSFNKDTCLASNLIKLKHKAVSLWKESGWIYIGFGEIHLPIRNPLPLMPAVHSLNTMKLKPRNRFIEDTFSHRKNSWMSWIFCLKGHFSLNILLL